MGFATIKAPNEPPTVIRKDDKLTYIIGDVAPVAIPMITATTHNIR